MKVGPANAPSLLVSVRASEEVRASEASNTFTTMLSTLVASPFLNDEAWPRTDASAASPRTTPRSAKGSSLEQLRSQRLQSPSSPAAEDRAGNIEGIESLEAPSTRFEEALLGLTARGPIERGNAPSLEETRPGSRLTDAPTSQGAFSHPSARPEGSLRSRPLRAPDEAIERQPPSMMRRNALDVAVGANLSRAPESAGSGAPVVQFTTERARVSALDATRHEGSEFNVRQPPIIQEPHLTVFDRETPDLAGLAASARNVAPDGSIPIAAPVESAPTTSHASSTRGSNGARAFSAAAIEFPEGAPETFARQAQPPLVVGDSLPRDDAPFEFRQSTPSETTHQAAPSFVAGIPVVASLLARAVVAPDESPSPKSAIAGADRTFTAPLATSSVRGGPFRSDRQGPISARSVEQPFPRSTSDSASGFGLPSSPRPHGLGEPVPNLEWAFPSHVTKSLNGELERGGTSRNGNPGAPERGRRSEPSFPTAPVTAPTLTPSLSAVPTLGPPSEFFGSPITLPQTNGRPPPLVDAVPLSFVDRTSLPRAPERSLRGDGRMPKEPTAESNVQTSPLPFVVSFDTKPHQLKSEEKSAFAGKRVDPTPAVAPATILEVAAQRTAPFTPEPNKSSDAKDARSEMTVLPPGPEVRTVREGLLPPFDATALTQVPPVAFEDPSLRVVVLPNIARLNVETQDGSSLSLQVRVHDGVTDIRAQGAAAHLIEAHAPDLRMALAREGLALGHFDSGHSERHRQSEVEHPFERTPRRSHPRPPPRASHFDGRLSVKA